MLVRPLRIKSCRRMHGSRNDKKGYAPLGISTVSVSPLKCATACGGSTSAGRASTFRQALSESTFAPAAVPEFSSPGVECVEPAQMMRRRGSTPTSTSSAVNPGSGTSTIISSSDCLTFSLAGRHNSSSARNQSSRCVRPGISAPCRTHTPGGQSSVVCARATSPGRQRPASSKRGPPAASVSLMDVRFSWGTPGGLRKSRCGVWPAGGGRRGTATRHLAG